MSMTPAPVLMPGDKPNTGLVSLIANESVAIPELVGTPDGFPRWCAVDVDDNGNAVFPSGNGGRIVGVSQESVLSGQVMTILLLGNGISWVVAGEALTCGWSLGSDDNGHAVHGSGLGVALLAAAGSGDVIPVLLSAAADVVS